MATEPTQSEAPETDVPEQASASLSDTLDIGSGGGEKHSSAPSVFRGRVDRFGVAMGTGRRKTAVARVRIKDGNGEFIINDRPIDDYFKFERDRNHIEAPLKATGMLGKVDIWVSVKGGGPTGQCGALVLGIARALQAKDSSLHPQLSEGNFLTRDGRMVERKKYGRKKARRSFQFSKR